MENQQLPQEVQATLPKFLVPLIVLSIILSVVAILVSVAALTGNTPDLEIEDSDRVQEMMAEEEEEEEEAEEVTEIMSSNGPNPTAIQTILDSTSTPEFQEIDYSIYVVDPATGDRALIEDKDSGLTLYAIPDDYNGRVFVLDYGEREHTFQPLLIDLNDLDELTPAPVDHYGFHWLHGANFLSPDQRYVASISDEFYRSNQRYLLNFYDLVEGRSLSPYIGYSDTQVASVDLPLQPELSDFPDFNVKWTSDNCVSFDLHDASTQVPAYSPRPKVGEDQFCIE